MVIKIALELQDLNNLYLPIITLFNISEPLEKKLMTLRVLLSDSCYSLPTLFRTAFSVRLIIPPLFPNLEILSTLGPLLHFLSPPLPPISSGIQDKAESNSQTRLGDVLRE